MIIVNDKAEEVTSERFRETAEKIFKKMEWSQNADSANQNG
ncbi:hypothetical protein SAMN05720468_10636 [Fibrobacter sp. UWEL]|nr:hypothetical protein SAMN05720468_10636 [Fibrobacter sp. UWEL]